MEINETVMRAKGGDLQAFSELYDCFAGRILSYIRIKIQNRQDAEDVLQDVFIKSYKGLGSLRPGELNFSAWLYKIAGNTINDYFRKKYRTPETVAIDENFDIADSHSLQQAVMVNSDVETARENFKQLPTRQRDVAELRFLQQLSVAETAKALRKSNLAVRMLQYRARKSLKYMMQKATS